MELQEVHPLVIRTRDGDITDVSLMNEKAYTKSVEREELWHLHRSTGRVLPYDEKAAMISLREQHRWYEAVIERAAGAGEGGGSAANGGTGAAGAGAGTAGASGTAGEETEAADVSDEPAALRYGTPDETAYGRYGASGPAHGEGIGTEHPALGCGPTLELLEQTILERKASLPEGSYTTHLFSSGDEKIRKKAGEEAVELLLARDEARMVSEAADLIYHLLVLLAYHDIPVSSVCGELAGRAGNPAERQDRES
jgi:phosphoribosyl-ATP pyrophosphohydrolase